MVFPVVSMCNKMWVQAMPCSQVKHAIDVAVHMVQYEITSVRFLDNPRF